MKKTILSMLAFLAIALLITLSSCKKEGMSPNASNPSVVSATSEIFAKNGRLVFKDEETFRKHIQWVSKNQDKPQVIIEKYKQLGLNKSMMEVSLESDKLNDDTESKEHSNFCKKYPNVFLPVEFENSILYSLQGSPSMAYLANTDGLFQIGSDIHRVSYSYYYILKGGDESKIASLILANGTISDPSITATSTHSQITRTPYYLTAYWNSNYRIVGESKHAFSAGYSEMNVKTTAQRKVLGVWGQTSNITNVSVTWPTSTGYRINAYGDTVPFTIPYKNTMGVPSTGWGQVYFGQGEVIFSSSHCVATHQGIGNGSNTSGTISFNKDIFH